MNPSVDINNNVEPNSDLAAHNTYLVVCPSILMNNQKRENLTNLRARYNEENSTAAFFVSYAVWHKLDMIKRSGNNYDARVAVRFLLELKNQNELFGQSAKEFPCSTSDIDDIHVHNELMQTCYNLIFNDRKKVVMMTEDEELVAKFTQLAWTNTDDFSLISAEI